MERLRHTLLHHQVYFSSPASFNDPFDCKVRPSFDGSPDQILAYLTRIAQMRSGADADLPRQQVEGARADPEYFEKVYSEFLRTGVPGLGVYCLSERPDDILMWSHYADSHRGICLFFAANYIFSDCAVERVNYPRNNKYPNFNFFTASKEEQIEAILLTKAKHWEYEREWRVIDICGPGLRDIHAEWLAGLIVGCETSQAKVAEIRRLASRREPALQLFRASQKPREFALSIERI